MDDGFPDFSFAFAHGGTSSPPEHHLSNPKPHSFLATSPSSFSSSSSTSSNISWGSSWGSHTSQAPRDESPFFQPSPSNANSNDAQPFFPEVWAPEPTTTACRLDTSTTGHKHSASNSSVNIRMQPWKTPARPNKLLAPGSFRLQPIEKATIVQRRTLARAV